LGSLNPVCLKDLWFLCGSALISFFLRAARLRSACPSSGSQGDYPLGFEPTIDGIFVIFMWGEDNFLGDTGQGVKTKWSRSGNRRPVTMQQIGFMKFQIRFRNAPFH
jgi:hypothetical protein